jgi:hypothetical protein
MTAAENITRNPEKDVGTRSSANLVNDQWTITNPTHNVVTTALWLDVALERHRHEVAQFTTATVDVSYQLDGINIDGDVHQVRSVMQWLHDAYHEAKTYDTRTRPQRYALQERLAENRVMPSEMAVMLDVDLHVAERFAGDAHVDAHVDGEARRARTLLHQLKTHRPNGAKNAHQR